MNLFSYCYEQTTTFKMCIFKIANDYFQPLKNRTPPTDVAFPVLEMEGGDTKALISDHVQCIIEKMQNTEEEVPSINTLILWRWGTCLFCC